MGVACRRDFVDGIVRADNVVGLKNLNPGARVGRCDVEASFCSLINFGIAVLVKLNCGCFVRTEAEDRYRAEHPFEVRQPDLFVVLKDLFIRWQVSGDDISPPITFRCCQHIFVTLNFESLCHRG